MRPRLDPPRCDQKWPNYGLNAANTLIKITKRVREHLRPSVSLSLKLQSYSHPKARGSRNVVVTRTSHLSSNTVLKASLTKSDNPLGEVRTHFRHRDDGERVSS